MNGACIELKHQRGFAFESVQNRHCQIMGCPPFWSSRCRLLSLVIAAMGASLPCGHRNGGFPALVVVTMGASLPCGHRDAYFARRRPPPLTRPYPQGRGVGDFVRFMDEGCPPHVIIAGGAALPLWSSRWGLPSLVVVAMGASLPCGRRGGAALPL